MNALIEARGLTISYAAVTALRSLDLDVTSGDQLIILGANGAGKTSAMLALAGLIRPNAGSLKVCGKETHKWQTRRFIEEGVALIPEGTRNFPSMTVSENLQLPSLILRRRHYTSLLKDVFDLFPVLYDRRRQRAGTLSGGEQRMLSIGRGLMLQPKALLIDEPTLGLASIIIERIARALMLLRERHIAIVISEQSLRFAETFGGRVLVLERGSVVCEVSDGRGIAGLEIVQAALLGRGATRSGLLKS
jgi:branched-chain amino acid transport system ATP-binding protein